MLIENRDEEGLKGKEYKGKRRGKKGEKNGKEEEKEGKGGKKVKGTLNIISRDSPLIKFYIFGKYRVYERKMRERGLKRDG